MKDQAKTKHALIQELASLRQRIEELEQSKSELKKEKEELKKSEASFRSYFDLPLHGIAITSPEKGWIQVNDRICSILGYSRDEIVRMTWSEITYPDDLAADLEQFGRVLSGQVDQYNMEKRFIRKDGKLIWVNLSVGCVRKPDGSVDHTIALLEDITSSKLTEEMLKEKTILAQTFMDALPCVALLIKPGTREIVALNKTAREAGARVGSTCFGSWSKSDNTCSFCRAPEAWSTGEHQSIEIESIGIFWEAHWVPVSEDLYLHYAFDITERKRAEEEKRNLEERLNRAEKMEALGILAGGVAHDLNNVLGIVVGYTEILLMGTDKSNPIRPKLVNIMEGGQKAATIVGDLLTLARRGVAGRDILNLNKIIADWLYSPEFEKLFSYHSAVKIKTDLDPDLFNISASSVHLYKAIFNLVSNASEAMPEGGLLTIKTTNQYLDKPIQGYDKIQEGDYVVISVSDTGEGINADDMKRIFEPFYTKKVMGRSGTGLGLAVVWGTVKDHNGYINVESEEGKGSVFTLYFPVTREELTAGQVAVSISEYMGKGETILVVDDVKGQRDLAEEMLRRLNYRVTSVSGGEEALSYLKEHKVDLIVLDMIMDPGMDGLDTYRKVLEIYPQQKAVIVSGFSESDRVKAAQALGAGIYVKKPYVIEKLGITVKKELDKT